MPDWLGWVELVLSVIGAAGAIGVLVLLHQWYIDNHSRRTLRFDGPAKGWWLADTNPPAADFILDVVNRRSVPARVFLLIGEANPLEIVDPGKSLKDVYIRILPGFWETRLNSGVEVPAKGSVPLALTAALPRPDFTGAIRVTVIDQGIRLWFLDYARRAQRPPPDSLMPKMAEGGHYTGGVETGP